MYRKRISIQPDWDDLINTKKEEDIWISLKHSQAPASNTFLKKDSSNFSILNVSNDKKTLKVNCKSDSETITALFIAPIQKFSIHFDSKNKQLPVYSIDVADNGLGLSASSDGSLLIWLTSTGEIRRKLTSHISDINVCKLFPSGIAAVSGGSDLRIKIWSAEDGSNPVTLTGHNGGVTDISIVDRGRNIVSVGRDGNCKLWDVGESRCLSTFYHLDSFINSCAIQSVINDDNLKRLIPSSEIISDEIISEREIGTENKLVAVGSEDCYLRVFALHSRKMIYEYKCESAVNCCCFINETTVACGTQNGHVYILDLIEPNSVKEWKEFRSSILSIQKFIPENSFIATTADGSCFAWTQSFSNENKTIELTGPDCEPVYKVAINEKHLYTACRDGFIRKYDLNHFLNL